MPLPRRCGTAWTRSSRSGCSASPARRATTARTSRSTGGTSTAPPPTPGRRWRYHYPQRPFPYDELVTQNAGRSKTEPEFELVDTGIFDDGRYWVVTVDYAKAGPDRPPDADHHRERGARGGDAARAAAALVPQHLVLGLRRPRAAAAGRARGPRRREEPPLRPAASWSPTATPEALFCDNETNTERLYGEPGATAYPKDGINDHVVHGAAPSTPDGRHQGRPAPRVTVPAGETPTRPGAAGRTATSPSRWTVDAGVRPGGRARRRPRPTPTTRR